MAEIRKRATSPTQSPAQPSSFPPIQPGGGFPPAQPSSFPPIQPGGIFPSTQPAISPGGFSSGVFSSAAFPPTQPAQPTDQQKIQAKYNELLPFTMKDGNINMTAVNNMAAAVTKARPNEIPTLGQLFNSGNQAAFRDKVVQLLAEIQVYGK